MDLKNLSDEELTKNLKALVAHERETLTNILHHLIEVERRRLYCGRKNLFHYAMDFLGYDEPQASKRLAAMRLLQELPALDGPIQNGDLKLTHICIAKSVFQNEKKNGREFSAGKKLEMFESISGLTVRQAERVAATFVPEAPPKKDKIRGVAGGNRLEGFASDETLAKLERVKGLMAHTKANPTLDEVLSELCDLALKEWSPAKEPKRKVKKNTKASVRRALWKRDQGACTDCGSTYAVEEDHILPRAAGGAYTLENMRLLCRKCNQRAAIKFYGQTKMDEHLRQ